jgi:hypothetical protein
MITAREVSYGLFGAWRLAHLDRRGMEYFDTSIDGFWRSFWAAALMAPPYALFLVLKFARQEVDLDPLRFILVEMIAYAILWTAFPLAAWYLVAALGKTNRYFGYIIACNWANIIQIAVMLPVFALVVGSGLPGGVARTIWFAVIVAALFYQYFIARAALEVDMPVAAGFVFLDFVLSFLREAIVIALEFPPGTQPVSPFG